MDFEINTKGKGLFLTLSTISLIIIMALTTILWFFISPRLHEIHFYFAKTVLYLLRAFYLIIISGIVFLYITCFLEKVFKFALPFVRISINFLFPITVLLGKTLSIPKDRIRNSFVFVNNSFIKAYKKLYNPSDVLILLPHCLQNTDCKYRINHHIENCVSCGKCDIASLKAIHQNYHVNIAIATGGTLARRIIVNVKPKLIIAVACERDLVDGILEVFPIPVYGLLNDRPEGPCINTRVSCELIEQILQKIIRREE
ncbi:MAG TPA: DUF116 domain-containing protein [Candidatus Cloacimonadota bacterium]|nr:DUF116 domain-containing protein [Candidatus Cloacimonadota bacterium]